MEEVAGAAESGSNMPETWGTRGMVLTLRVTDCFKSMRHRALHLAIGDRDCPKLGLHVVNHVLLTTRLSPRELVAVGPARQRDTVGTCVADAMSAKGRSAPWQRDAAGRSCTETQDLSSKNHPLAGWQDTQHALQPSPILTVGIASSSGGSLQPGLRKPATAMY